MSDEENRTVALEFISQVYNEGKLELIEKYASSDLLNPGSTLGLERMTQSVSSLRETFPRLECKVVETISQDDRVVLRLAGKGVQSGPFMGLSPTGKKINFWGVMILRFRAGRIVEFWSLVDTAGILTQMRD